MRFQNAKAFLGPPLPTTNQLNRKVKQKAVALKIYS